MSAGQAVSLTVGILLLALALGGGTYIWAREFGWRDAVMHWLGLLAIFAFVAAVVLSLTYGLTGGIQ